MIMLLIMHCFIIMDRNSFVCSLLKDELDRLTNAVYTNTVKWKIGQGY